MSKRPAVRFLSLFVPDLPAAARRYEAIFGTPPMQHAVSAPHRHPFSPSEPVVFDLGDVEVALYQADGKTTHAGDVGIGVVTEAPSADTSAQAARAGARVFPSVQKLAGDEREMVVFMTPDRHFFEVVSRRTSLAKP